MSEPPAGDDAAPPLAILYTNYRGETAWRRVRPMAVRFGATEHHPQPQWLLDAVDLDKGALRTFALRDLRRSASTRAPSGPGLRVALLSAAPDLCFLGEEYDAAILGVAMGITGPAVAYDRAVVLAVAAGTTGASQEAARERVREDLERGCAGHPRPPTLVEPLRWE